MKKILLVALCLTVPLTGCAMFATQSEFDDLNRRVGLLEGNRISSREDLAQTSETITYTSNIEIKAKSPSDGARVSMSNKEIQIALDNAGYYNGPIDGKLGKVSKRAIRDFQAKNGLKVDGVAGQKTQKALLRYLTK